MKRLILLRHAKAVAKSLRDFERALAPRGRAQMKFVARHLEGEGLKPDLALVSPSVRTRETWDLTGQTDVPVRFDQRIYEASDDDLLSVLREAEPTAGTVVLVGHNPAFEDLARRLVRTGGEDDLARMQAKYPTASVAIIDFDLDDWAKIAPRTGRLVGFATPASLGSGEDD